MHDEQIGEILAKLDELGIADNTFVMYSTDNGPENDTWPDGANTPFNGQKYSHWEGGWRVPCFIRWPGKIEAGTILNGIASHIDMFPTLLAIAGDPDVATKLLNGATVGEKTFKVHLDGYNMVPYFTGKAKESPRQALIYFSDDGEVIAVRVGDYKFNLAEQHATRCGSGSNRSSSCAYRPSTCAAIRSSAPTSTRTRTMTGWSITCRRCI